MMDLSKFESEKKSIEYKTAEFYKDFIKKIQEEVCYQLSGIFSLFLKTYFIISNCN